ncbi:MAG: hypothetical protein ACK5AZ_11660 [Bryobacteraceae bacterium]
MNYESSIWQESVTHPGVRYRVAKMSFGRRLELTKRVRELSRGIAFHESDARLEGKLEASILASEVDRLYLEWGLCELHGLEIDGAEASIQSLIARGPEALCLEILDTVKRESGLTESERKN